LIRRKSGEPPAGYSISFGYAMRDMRNYVIVPVGLARGGGSQLQFAVGFKLQGKTGHVIVDAEDALVAALKVKLERPEALITYVRRQNKRGDTRHPVHGLGS